MDVKRGLDAMEQPSKLVYPPAEARRLEVEEEHENKQRTDKKQC